jgi:hypothetical protein
MENPLTEKLKLSTQEKSQLGGRVGRLKSIADFLSDGIDALKDTTTVSAIAQAAPWAGAFGGALSEVVPPVKFALELFKALTEEHDPDALGFLASTLAYQRAVEQTIASIESPENAKKAGRQIKQRLREREPAAGLEMQKFSFKTANQHPFVAAADDALRLWAESVGYGEAQSRAIVQGVHRRFVANLKTILSHGELKERFAPFTQKMELGTEEEQAYDALLEHAEHQRRLFEEAPVFEKEPFALQHVYVDTECGKLTWGQISREPHASDKGKGKEPERVDPFSEQWGGRQPLVETVLQLMSVPGPGDAIVVQGVAGSGKSSFTLKLCSELIREGLHPIRVRLRDLNLSRPVTEALPRALFPADRLSAADGPGGPRPDDLFLGGQIFKEQTAFRGATICPYVLILDGWDEISISATTGFKLRITNMLSELRSEYLKNTQVPVRVILTGRPSNAVSESKFLLEKTTVLTMRPLRPEQLEDFVGQLKHALEERPVRVEVKDESETWKIEDPTRFASVIGRYRAEFEATTRADANQTAGQSPPEGSMAVLGLPLLAHLAIRLMSQWRGADLAPLVENPTTLYRSLVDLTCGKGGKYHRDQSSVADQFRITGTELRDLLWKTATAMTVYGEESLSFMELALRLGLDVDDLDRKINSATEDHVLSQLMISFFFKGGQRHLGCEFLHKSFREYLYAEGVVEMLKDYGRETQSAPDERELYWADFDEKDPRHGFSRRLCEALAAQWLSPEVVGHLEQLILWETGRAGGGEDREAIGTRTESLDLDGWARVRDGLADLWDWWAEGVHLRPQVAIDRKTRIASFETTYVQELIEHAAPYDPALRNYMLEPKRTLTMDSHLGDALFRLCATTHYQLAVATGWLEGRDRETPGALPAQIWEGVSEHGAGPKRYQSLVEQGEREWVLFAPSGPDTRYFTNYVHRINSAGWRPFGDFPTGVDLSGADLRSTSCIFSVGSPVKRTRWNHANISQANYAGSNLGFCTMIEILAYRAVFMQAAFGEAVFDNSALRLCFFTYTTLGGSSFKKASLIGTYFDRASMTSTNVEDAVFSGAKLNVVELIGTDLRKAVDVPAEILAQHYGQSDNSEDADPYDSDD